MINSTIRNLIADNETAIIDAVLADIRRRFPDSTYSEKNRMVDIHIILEAISNDIACYPQNSAYAAYKMLTAVLATKKLKVESLYMLTSVKKHTLSMTNNQVITDAITERIRIIHHLTSSKIVVEVKWWLYLAKTLPLAALSILIWVNTFMPDDIIQFTIMMIVLGFFIVSVSWWFWAIWTVAYVVLTIQHAHKTFDEISGSLSSLVRDIYSNKE